MVSSPPTTIAFLVNEDAYFLLHRLHLARAVREQGHKVIVMARETVHRAAIEAEGFQFHPVRLRRGNLNPLWELVTFWDILRGYRQHRPRLVHQFTFKLIVLGTLAARWNGVKAIVNAVPGLGYAFTGGGWRRGVLRAIAKAGYRTACRGPNTRILFENEDDRRYFVRKRLARETATEVLPGAGIDTEKFAPTADPGGIPVVLCASRMLWDKGVGDLIDAGRLLRSRGVAFRLLLAGEPDPHNPATIQAETLRYWDAKGEAEWLGFQRDMPGLIADSHIVCLPSYREGLPVSLLEAASCGRPIVTTDMPGCREVVRHGKNGLLVQPHDTGALADALARLIGDAKLREEMGRAGREMVLAEFAVTHVIRRTLALYEKLLGGDFAGALGERGEA